MTKKLIHEVANSSACLRCDEPTCDYISPPGKHTWGEHLVGTPCPKCGANLLTQLDYENQNQIIDMIKIINEFGEALGLGTEEPDMTAIQVGIRSVNGKIVVEEK